MTPATTAATKESPKKKRRTPLTAAKKPASLEEAQREILRLVCAHSVAITKAVIREALDGKYVCARFLFEAVGLCAVKGEETEDVAERESLAGLLLKQWQLPAEGSQVTEVSEGIPDLASTAPAPVKS
jgi:hypothetical protein